MFGFGFGLYPPDIYANKYRLYVLSKESEEGNIEVVSYWTGTSWHLINFYGAEYISCTPSFMESQGWKCLCPIKKHPIGVYQKIKLLLRTPMRTRMKMRTKQMRE